MTKLLTSDRGLSLGFRVRKRRVTRMITRQELARTAGVSCEEVDLLEHNLPLRLPAKLSILRVLWANNAG